jgi:cell division protein FtsB
MNAANNPKPGAARKVPGMSQETPPSLHARVARSLFRMRRRIATGVAVVVAILLGYHVVVGQNGVTAYVQKRNDDRELKKQLESLQHENERMKLHVDRLQNDPDAIEHEARQRLHYARPGEVIYTLNDKPQPQPTGKAANSSSKPPDTQ